MKHTNLERVLRDLRVFRIFEGANDVLRLFIALTGLNFAGKHLTALTRSPVGMLGLVLNKVRSTLGVSGEGALLVPLVSPQLSDAASLTGKAIDSFGDASLYLLKNYGKGVINEQFRLVRLADAAIHLYGMVCVLSRATNTIKEHPQLAEHEINLARLVCYQGFKTIKRCLSELDKSEDRKMFDLMKSLHGGAGFMKHTNLERVLRDLRVFRIFEGANDVLRLFIALTGLNFAGKHLTALTRSPVGMLGLVLNKVRSTLGVSGEGALLVPLVSPQLSDAASLTGKAIDSFGDASLYLLKNYGKGVINEQFRLVRLADAAIHLYGMVCVLSRATNTIKEHPQLAEHEINLARLVCYQGFKTIKRCLSELDKSEDRKMFDLMKSVSFDVCNHGGVVYRSPLGL
ncbi:hypothetical protein AHF37_09612 [Paragonimus kellicotti]|nr:hypothetical protein AHF37_09612 [Paragonimus kellicotti]